MPIYQKKNPNNFIVIRFEMMKPWNSFEEHRLNPSQIGEHSIYLPQRDGRLS